jgi:YjbE family integral membrane protein
MIDTFLADFQNIFTATGAFALLNIILIDVVMSGDNAILIGMATKNLPTSMKKRAIFWGVLGATILRVAFSLGVVFLMKVSGLEFLGAILLLYVVWKFYREIRAKESHHEEWKNTSNFIDAIKTIIVADVAMSLDNVLAVGGAAHGNIANLVIGLIVSIILMVVASGYIAKLLDRYPSIQWVWLFVILFTALEMMEKWFSKAVPDMIGGIPETSIFTGILFVVVGGFAILQAKYLKADHSLFAEWSKAHGRTLMVTIFLLLILIVNFGGKITEFMNSHHWYKYGFIMICVLGILEIIRLKEKK